MHADADALVETPYPAGAPHRREAAERLLPVLGKALGHDLPNQLVSIQGLARVLELEDGANLSEAGRDYLQRIATAAKRLHTQARALAAIIKATGDRRPAEAVPLASAAREAAAEVSQLFPGRPVVYHFDDAAPVLELPREALHQVLVQLLRNAVQAASDERPAHVEVGGSRDVLEQTFWVADRGRGLPPERCRLLADFFAGRAGPPGGLGLVHVRQVVDAWGGRVHVQSEPGRGCVVTVVVPGP